MALAAPTFLASSSGGGAWGKGYRDNPGALPPPPPTPEQQARLDGIQRGINEFSVWHGPSLALNDQQAGILANQIGGVQMAYGMDTNALRQNAGLDMAKQNFGPQYDAIERLANLRQMGMLGTLDNLAFQQLGNQFAGTDLAKKQAWEQAGRQQTAAKSDATVRGAMSAPGFKRTMGDIQTELANQLSGIGQQREGYRLGALEQQVGRKEQQAKLEDRNKILDIKAKEYGVDKAKISANLQQGLAKLGLNQYMDVNTLLDELNSTDLNRQAIATQIFRDAMTYSDFFTILPQQSMPSIRTPEQQKTVDDAVSNYVKNS